MLAFGPSSGGVNVGAIVTRFDPIANRVTFKISSTTGPVSGLVVGIAVDGKIVGTTMSAADGSGSLILQSITAGTHVFTATVSIPITTTSTKTTSTVTMAVSASITAIALGPQFLAFGLVAGIAVPVVPTTQLGPSYIAFGFLDGLSVN